MIINEYSNKETTDGDATIYAEKIQTKAIDAANPKNKINFHVYSIFENLSLNMNCIVGSKFGLLSWPLPIKIYNITHNNIAIR